MARDESDKVDMGLVDLPPTARQTWSAVVFAAVVMVALGAVAPFANIPLGQLTIIFPLLDTIVFITDLITAVLLYSQFTISRSRAVFALATGYLFTALIVIPHALTIRGAFSPTGLLGANNQTGSWLFIFWHLGFAASLLAYAVLRSKKPVAPDLTASPLPSIFWSAVAIIGLIFGLTWLATAGAALLPPIVLDATRISPFVVYPILLTILVSAAAFVALAVGKRTLLDQWLMVVALVYIAELTFSGLLPSVRFSVGFYTGRVCSLITSSIVLIILLAETTQLYVRLSYSNAMLQRERRNKLLNLEAVTASIAHEVKQPLAAIGSNGEAALIFLNCTPPDFEKLRLCLSEITEDTHRAGQILDNLRALFGGLEGVRERVDVNNLVLNVLRSFESNFEKYGIETRPELSANLPIVLGHSGQLREVLANLIQNAIDAMGAVDGRRILKIKTIEAENAPVVVIEDNGPGIVGEKANIIFDPFVSTKPQSMGLGLAICRLIVERHAGRLLASQANPRGAIFRLILPRSNLS